MRGVMAPSIPWKYDDIDLRWQRNLGKWISSCVWGGGGRNIRPIAVQGLSANLRDAG